MAQKSLIPWIVGGAAAAGLLFMFSQGEAGEQVALGNYMGVDYKILSGEKGDWFKSYVCHTSPTNEWVAVGDYLEIDDEQKSLADAEEGAKRYIQEHIEDEGFSVQDKGLSDNPTRSDS